MLIVTVVALTSLFGAALAPPSPIEDRQQPKVGALASCQLPLPDRRDNLVILRMSGGESISTVAVTGLDKGTTTGEIKIGPGSNKLRVVLAPTESMIVRFSGRIDRLSKVVFIHPAGGGVTGVPASKVHFSIGRKCSLPHDPEKLRKALGKAPDVASEIGSLHRGWTDGKNFHHEEAVAPERNGEHTYLVEQLDWLHPGGVMPIDPAAVVSSGKPVTYSVLPYAAGAVELERSGALGPVTRPEIEAWKELARVRQGKGSIETFTFSGTPYRATRPIRVPAGLCGAHRLTFFVPYREYLSGDWCHSDVLALDGRILAPSWYANDPHCGSTQFTAFAQPYAPGPLRLLNIYCDVTYPPPSYYGVPRASPDARYMALFPTSHGRSPLRVQEIIADAAPPRDHSVIGTPYSNRAFWQSVPPFEWREDSLAIWAAKPEYIAEPKRSSLQPALVRLDGTTEPLPELKHPAGPVEAMQWVGSSGRAMAQFRGDPFDPVTRKILPPTYGMVDSKTGAILDDFEPAAYEQMRRTEPKLKEFFYPERIVATQRPEGRLHALMDFGLWVSWPQNEEPRVFRELPQASGGAMSADGKTILLLRPNLPGEDNRAWIIHCGGDAEEGGRHGPCPERQAKEGTWASLHDIETGKQLWALRWIFDRYDRLGEVSLSPDGKLALIPLFSRMDPTKTFIAVVSMKNGEVVQTLPTPRSNYSMGFAEGGKTAWIVSMRSTTIYRVQ